MFHWHNSQGGQPPWPQHHHLTYAPSPQFQDAFVQQPLVPYYPSVAPSGVYVLPPHASFGPALVSHWPVLLAPPEACHQQMPAWQGVPAAVGVGYHEQPFSTVPPRHPRDDSDTRNWSSAPHVTRAPVHPNSGLKESASYGGSEGAPPATPPAAAGQQSAADQSPTEQTGPKSKAPSGSSPGRQQQQQRAGSGAPQLAKSESSANGTANGAAANHRQARSNRRSSNGSALGGPKAAAPTSAKQQLEKPAPNEPRKVGKELAPEQHADPDQPLQRISDVPLKVPVAADSPPRPFRGEAGAPRPGHRKPQQPPQRGGGGGGGGGQKHGGRPEQSKAKAPADAASAQGTKAAAGSEADAAKDGSRARHKAKAKEPSAGGEAPAHRQSNRPPCAYFLKTGECGFGDLCKFSHPVSMRPQFTVDGLPKRPGEIDCPFHQQYSWCGFSKACKYNHREKNEYQTDGAEPTQGADAAAAAAIAAATGVAVPVTARDGEMDPDAECLATDENGEDLQVLVAADSPPE